MIAKRFLTIVVAVLICLGILVGSALAVSDHPLPQNLATAVLSKDNNLASLSWEVSGTVTGAGYTLTGSTRGTGTPCCCTYLPCLMRSAP